MRAAKEALLTIAENYIKFAEMELEKQTVTKPTEDERWLLASLFKPLAYSPDSEAERQR